MQTQVNSMFLTDIYSHDGDKEEEADQTLQVLSSRQVCRCSKVYVHNQVVRYAGIIHLWGMQVLPGMQVLWSSQVCRYYQVVLTSQEGLWQWCWSRWRPTSACWRRTACASPSPLSTPLDTGTLSTIREWDELWSYWSLWSFRGCWAPILAYIEQQFDAYLEGETRVQRVEVINIVISNIIIVISNIVIIYPSYSFHHVLSGPGYLGPCLPLLHSTNRPWLEAPWHRLHEEDTQQGNYLIFLFLLVFGR